MSRQRLENREHAYQLIQKFNKTEWPAEYPWAMEFLYKVRYINEGRVNTANQQDTLDTLWRKYGTD